MDARATDLAARRAILADDLGAAGCDALVFSRDATFTYVTGYWTTTWQVRLRPLIGVLFAGGSVAVVCAPAEAETVAARVPGATVIAVADLDVVADGEPGYPDGRVQFAPAFGRAVRALLETGGIGRIAVDGHEAIFPPVERLAAWLGPWPPGIVDGSAIVWRRRLRKSRYEIEALRAANAVLDRALVSFTDSVAPGLSERELAGRLNAAIFEAGADRLGYTAVAVLDGARGLFGDATDRIWRQGELLFVDGGAVVDGYYADLCRTLVAGNPPAGAREAQTRVRDALDAAVTAFRPTMTAADLALATLDALGLDDAAAAGRVGHGIGLHIPEPPSLHPLDTTPLEDGLVFCIEPNDVVEGVPFVIEEAFAVVGGRLDRLCAPAPAGLVEL